MEWQIILILLASPIFISISGLWTWFFVRRNRKTNKALKKAIKSGQWTQDFNYIFTGHLKEKLDKFIFKTEKKHIKKKNKIEINKLKYK